MIKIIKHRFRILDNKHLKKAGGLIGRNVVEITIKMKTIVRKLLLIKIVKLRLRNLDNKHLKKAGGHIEQNVVEITRTMKTIVRKPSMVNIINIRLRNLDNKHLKKAGGHIGRNVVEITRTMKTIAPKTLNDKNHQASSQIFTQLKYLIIINLNYWITFNCTSQTYSNIMFRSYLLNFETYSWKQLLFGF